MSFQIPNQASKKPIEGQTFDRAVEKQLEIEQPFELFEELNAISEEIERCRQQAIN